MSRPLGEPRSLRDPAEIARRRAMLHLPHVAPLASFVEGLRIERPNLQFPDFDPLDGGVAADTLFLLEKPGPTTCAPGGSGFVSRDNDNQTAEAIFRFMREAAVPRTRAALWNAIPGWNGTIRTSGAERRDGLRALEALMPLLPRIRTVVLVGGTAHGATAFFENRRLSVFKSAHPSPQVRAARPDLWRAIPNLWAEAARPRKG